MARVVMAQTEIFELRKSLSFEAAHRLPYVPEGHKCGRIHGHSFQVTVVLRGPLNSKFGWLVDYADIKDVTKVLLERLDHRFLNEIPGLENPTSEVLAKWIFEQLKPKLDELSQIIVGETCTTECRYPAG